PVNQDSPVELERHPRTQEGLAPEFRRVEIRVERARSDNRCGRQAERAHDSARYVGVIRPGHIRFTPQDPTGSPESALDSKSAVPLAGGKPPRFFRAIRPPPRITPHTRSASHETRTAWPTVKRSRTALSSDFPAASRGKTSLDTMYYRSSITTVIHAP